MDKCNICDEPFKRRVVDGQFRGFYRRSIKPITKNGKMSLFDAARKCVSYQV